MTTRKTILITGASSGFGKQAVQLLLDRGHTVIAALRGGQKRLEALYPDDLKKHGSRIRAVEIHMDKAETFEGASKLIREELGGRLDALVNNAGYGLFGAIEDMSADQLRYQMEVNFFGPILLAKKLIPELRAAKGRIINVSSVAGLSVFPFYGAYCASKHALSAATEGLYYDLKPFGVQVNVIEPGGFKTDFLKALQMGDGASDRASPNYRRSQNFRKNLLEMGEKTADPIHVARLIARNCERPRLPFRSVIGIDAKALYFLQRILPNCLRVTINDWVFKLGVFKDRSAQAS